jgi:hypothetical protein
VAAQIIKRVDEDAVYYLIHWSHLRKADKYEINGTVPSVAGIFELYFMDERKSLRLMMVAKAWYGGLRNKLRKLTDPTLERDPRRRAILDRHDCYYRYAVTNSYPDMSDILYFFGESRLPDHHPFEPSGRYVDIFVDETSPDKVVTI